jgi:glutamyl-tRNA reductase
MHIHSLGINHRTADVGLRERLAFDEDGVKAALARLGCGSGSQPDAVSEMVILSTCNRVEIYAIAPEPNFPALEQFLSEVRVIPVEEIEPHLYRYLDEDAVRHLFRVASGLDSLVVGEPQILGQVMNAFERARSQAAIGPVLTRLFQAALFTGKRARTETDISHNPSSISSVAVHLAGNVVTHLSRAKVVVVGAGEMAELAVEALIKRGASQILVINRTMDRAESLAERWGGQAATFEFLPDALQDADILITSTGAPHTILSAKTVKAALQARKKLALVIIDIAVPRDVEVEVGELPGVRLFDIDMLEAQLAESLAYRAKEIPRVEAILAAEQKEFMDYLRTLDVIPIIAEIRQQAELIRQAELDKTLRRMADLTPEERKRLEALTLALVKKLLHTPITRLRAEAGSPMAAEYAAAARTLFGLERSSCRTEVGINQPGAYEA